MDHLLLHYPVAYDLWTMVWNLFGLCWVMPQRVLDLLAAWQGTFGKHRIVAFWRAVLNCIMRCLWWEQNEGCFEGCEWSMLEIKSLFFHTLLVNWFGE